MEMVTPRVNSSQLDVPIRGIIAKCDSILKNSVEITWFQSWLLIEWH